MKKLLLLLLLIINIYASTTFWLNYTKQGPVSSQTSDCGGTRLVNITYHENCLGSSRFHRDETTPEHAIINFLGGSREEVTTCTYTHTDDVHYNPPRDYYDRQAIDYYSCKFEQTCEEDVTCPIDYHYDDKATVCKCIKDCNVDTSDYPIYITNTCKTEIDIPVGTSSEFEFEAIICDCIDNAGEQRTWGRPNPNYISQKIKYPNECQSHIASYVIPRTQAFHEDIAIAGSKLTLHYSSNYTQIYSGNDFNSSFLLAKGWDIDVHHHLIDTTLFKGNGEKKEVNLLHENGYTLVKDSDTAYYFNENGLHVKSVNQLTDAILYTFTYIDNRLHSITDINSNSITLSYDDLNHISEISTDTNQITTIQTDTQNLLKKVIYEDGSSYQFDYDSNSLLLQKTDPNTNVFTHIFDSNGRITQIIDSQNATYTYETTNGTNEQSIIHYPENEDVTYINYPLENGFLNSSVIYPSGDIITTKQSIDADIYIQNSCDMTYIKYYNNTNLMKQKLVMLTTPNGLTQIVNYNTIYETDKEIEKMVYNGFSTIKTIDYANHTITVDYPLSSTEIYHFDNDMNRLLEYNNSTAFNTFYEYDSNNRLLHVKHGNREKYFTYDTRANLTSISENNNTQITRYTYDTRDQLSSIIKPDGSTISFTYDANGNITRLNTPSPTTHNFNYNKVNKPVSWQTPTGYETRYAYDKQRRLKTITKPSQKELHYNYSNGQLISIVDDEGNTTIEYTCGSKPLHVRADTGENISYMYDGDLLTSISYNGILNQTISLSYNNSFLPQNITYANITQTFNYDVENRLIQSSNANISYTPTSMTLQENNFIKTLHVNSYSEFQNTIDTINSKNIYSQRITSRDLSGKILSTIEHIDKKTIHHNYRYDSNSRLISSESTSGKMIFIPFDGLVIPILKDRQTYKESFAYDSEGNRVEHNISINNNTTTKTATFYHNALEQIDNTYYTYDEDGYLTSKSDDEGTTLYTYGIYGELKSVITPQKTIEYLHNANHQRVAKKVDGVITEKYLWRDLTTLLAVYNGDDTLKTRYYYTNQRTPYKMTQNNQTYYLSYNHIGSLRAVTKEDGTIVKEIEYSAYGEIIKDTNESLSVNIGFAGGLYDSDTKLTRFGYRDYDAQSGKWTAKDPIGFGGGDSNLYGYVLNDPVNGVDPTGEIAWVAIPFIIGGLTSYLNAPDINDIATTAAPYGFFGGLCGEEGSKQATWIPDISPKACQEHDNCYSDCSKSQWECDYNLFLSNVPYGLAVMLGGQGAFNNAQKGCECK